MCDYSNQEHRDMLDKIISRKSGEVRKISNQVNKGQILSFYAGVKAIDADFYCLLDPDDRYLPPLLKKW